VRVGHRKISQAFYRDLVVEPNNRMIPDLVRLLLPLLPEQVHGLIHS
jgi:hypothetical protein